MAALEAVGFMDSKTLNEEKRERLEAALKARPCNVRSADDGILWRIFPPLLTPSLVGFGVHWVGTGCDHSKVPVVTHART